MQTSRKFGARNLYRNQPFRRAAELKLALAPLDEWINVELLQFIKDLDLVVGKSGRSGALRVDLIAALQQRHAQKRAELMANGEKLLKLEQEKWKVNLRKNGWRTFKTENLRTWAKCIGMKPDEYRTTTLLESSMKKMFDRKRKSKAAPRRTTKKRRLNE